MSKPTIFTWVEHPIVETTWLVLSDDQFRTMPKRQIEQIATVFGPPGEAGTGSLADGVVINGGNF